MPAGYLNVVPSPVQSNFPAVAGADGSVRTPSAFGDYGVPDDYVSGAFDPGVLYNSRRSMELEFRASYFHCKQHDGKLFRFDGTPLGGPGGGESYRTTQPMLSSAQSSAYIPLSQRRPCAPYRLGRKMTSAFTGMLFGEGRWPQMRSKDPETQAAALALEQACNLALNFVHCRNLGGSSGTAGVSWCFVDGKPRVKAHRGSRIHVLSWADEDAKVPAHVTEIKLITQLAPDPKDGTLRPAEFWQRTDWTQVADVVFQPVRVDTDGPLLWKLDEVRSRYHGDGECHFAWIQNLPSEDDTEDGACDYGETFEQMDSLDELNSVHVNGTKLNLDPTLHLGLDPSDREGVGFVKKGSENAIITTANGKAEYLQLEYTEAGEKVVALQRGQILEVNECVVPDPDKVAAAASSGEALKIVYGPMLARCDVLRMQWGPAIALVINQMLRSWRRLRTIPVLVPVPANDVEVPVTDAATGEEVPQTEEAPQDLVLPPRTLRRPKEDGSGEEEVDIDHGPGTGEVSLEWGAYFKPSGQEKQFIVTSLGTATGGKPILSQRGGSELASNLFDRDATDEWEAIQAEAAAAREQDGDIYGGEVGAIGSEVKAPSAAAPPTDGTDLVDLAPADKIKAMTVNEVRAKAMRLGPLLLADGTPDPDGEMKFVAYLAKLEAQGQVEGEAAGPPPPEDISLPEPGPQPIPGFGGTE